MTELKRASYGILSGGGSSGEGWLPGSDEGIAEWADNRAKTQSGFDTPKYWAIDNESAKAGLVRVISVDDKVLVVVSVLAKGAVRSERRHLFLDATQAGRESQPDALATLSVQIQSFLAAEGIGAIGVEAAGGAIAFESAVFANSLSLLRAVVESPGGGSVDGSNDCERFSAGVLVAFAVKDCELCFSLGMGAAATDRATMPVPRTWAIRRNHQLNTDSMLDHRVKVGANEPCMREMLNVARTAVKLVLPPQGQASTWERYVSIPTKCYSLNSVSLDKVEEWVNAHLRDSASEKLFVDECKSCLDKPGPTVLDRIARFIDAITKRGNKDLVARVEQVVVDFYRQR